MYLTGLYFSRSSLYISVQVLEIKFALNEIKNLLVLRLWLGPYTTTPKFKTWKRFFSSVHIQTPYCT